MTTDNVIRLAACEACGNPVSTLARDCPACGHPAQAARDIERRKVITGRVLIGLFAVMWFLLTWTGAPGLALIAIVVSGIVLALSFRRPRVAVYGGYAVLAVVALCILSAVA